MLDNDTRPGPPGSTMLICPVNPCPWRHQVTKMTILGGYNQNLNGLLCLGVGEQVSIPLPEIMTPQEQEAVLAACRAAARTAVPPVSDIKALVKFIYAVSTAQDEAMLRTHLLTEHTDAQLRDTLDEAAYDLLHHPKA